MLYAYREAITARSMVVASHTCMWSMQVVPPSGQVFAAQAQRLGATANPIAPVPRPDIHEQAAEVFFWLHRVSEMLEVMQLAADQDPQQGEPADTPTDDRAIIFEQVCLAFVSRPGHLTVVVRSAAAQLHANSLQCPRLYAVVSYVGTSPLSSLLSWQGRAGCLHSCMAAWYSTSWPHRPLECLFKRQWCCLLKDHGPLHMLGHCHR